ncbi:COG4223 family protein [Ostreiculturibacter nitratireducens]|uniref:COG4223 family protein n=1 Tax=Ostreiculturibacter nitratireducens TaxID=3075226 RepID=UPI0031B63ED0
MAKAQEPDPKADAEVEAAEVKSTEGTEAQAEETVPTPDDVVAVEEPAPEPPQVDEVPQEAPAEPEPVKTEPPVRRRGGFWPTALGGVVAAGIGAGAALFVFPEGWRAPEPVKDDAAITERISTVEAELAQLKSERATIAFVESRFGEISARIDEIAAQFQNAGPGEVLAPSGDTAALAAELADLKANAASVDFVTTGLDEMSRRIDALQDSLRAIGAAPGEAGSAEGIAALAADVAELRSRAASAEFVTNSVGELSARIDSLESEIAAIRAELAEGGAAAADIAAAAAEAEAKIAEAEAEATRLKQETEAAMQRVAARAALSHVQAAFETGTPMAGALDELAAAGVEIPEALRATADGMPSLQALQGSFPDAARAALTESLKVTTEDAGTMDRIGAFLRSQTGARSLEPREGDDPDAVLSRAEAALRGGDLAAAIAELDGLPEEGKAAMEPWTAGARARLAAAEAIAALPAALD